MKFNINLDEDFDLRVSSHVIHVKFVDKSHEILSHTDEENKEETTSDFGCYIGDEYTIYARKSDPYSIKLSTLLHELIHVIEQIYILDFDHKELNIVSEVFAQIFIDNFGGLRKKMDKDRIKCGSCNSEYHPRKYVDGSLNYKCPVCEQQQEKTNESVELEKRKVLHD